MKIFFLPLRNLHIPHLLPVHKWLATQTEQAVDLFWTSPPFTPSFRNNPGSGVDHQSRRELMSQGIRWTVIERIEQLRPEVIVVADAISLPGYTDAGGRLVNVNHGLISKGWFYTDSPSSERENNFSLICVPGPYHKAMLEHNVKVEIRVCGLVKFDAVANGSITREAVFARWGIKPTPKVVLFAPTFNTELSGVPIVTDDVRRWAAEGLTVLVKLHGMAPPEWVELYRYIAQIEPNVHLIEELDLTPSLVAADVVVSDVSSAFMEAAILDKPLVLINNPARIRYPSFDPRDIEYAMRDVGIQVERREEVLPAILNAFANPQGRAEQRQIVRRELGGPLDGRAAERVGRGVLSQLGTTVR